MYNNLFKIAAKLFKMVTTLVRIATKLFKTVTALVRIATKLFKMVTTLVRIATKLFKIVTTLVKIVANLFKIATNRSPFLMKLEGYVENLLNFDVFLKKANLKRYKIPWQMIFIVRGYDIYH